MYNFTLSHIKKKDKSHIIKIREKCNSKCIQLFNPDASVTLGAGAKVRGEEEGIPRGGEGGQLVYSMLSGINMNGTNGIRETDIPLKY